MCLAVPLKITEINGNDGVGERDGVSRKIRLDFLREPKIGEYVIVHAGFAIEKMNPMEAEESISLAKEVQDALGS